MLEELPIDREVRISAAQIATLSRICQSFDVTDMSVKLLDGYVFDHEGMIAAQTRVHGPGSGSSATAEWSFVLTVRFCRGAAAAADSKDWLKEGQEAV